MNPNRPARLNRAVLALLGLLALLAGLFVLLAGTGAIAVLPVRADAPLLPANLSLPGWVPWAGTAVAILVGLSALRWLIAQTIRRPTGSDWQLAPDTQAGITHIDSDTAAVPLAEEIADYPGVQSATARLTGPRQHPRLHLRVTADDRADISELRERIDRAAMPRLLQALDFPSLDADLLLRLNTSGSSRTR